MRENDKQIRPSAVQDEAPVVIASIATRRCDGGRKDDAIDPRVSR
jgi:hypothetical protein